MLMPSFLCPYQNLTWPSTNAQIVKSRPLRDDRQQPSNDLM